MSSQKNHSLRVTVSADYKSGGFERAEKAAKDYESRIEQVVQTQFEFVDNMQQSERTLSGLRAEIDLLENQLAQLESKFADASSRNAREEMLDYSNSILDVGQHIDMLVQALNKQEKATLDSMNAAERASKTNEKLETDVKQLGQNLEFSAKRAREFDLATRDFTAALKQSLFAWEQANNRTILLKKQYKEWRHDINITADQLEALGHEITAAEKKEHLLLLQARALTKEQRELAISTGLSTNAFDSFLNRMDKAESYITGYTRSQREANENAKALIRSTNRIGDEITQLTTESKRGTSAIERLGLAMSEAADRANSAAGRIGLDTIAMGNIIADQLQDAAYQVRAFVEESVQAYFDFDRATREVFTLAPELTADMRVRMQDDLLAISTEIGRLPEEVIPAVYDAISAGLPPENALTAIQVASKAARAGVAELQPTMKLGASILNAYQLEASELNNVYDDMFWLVKNGVITFNELNSGFSAVTSVASESQVPLNQVTAAIATMTRQGDSAQEAFELLSLLLQQISVEGTVMADTFREAAGTGFRDFIKQGGTLAEAMALLQQHADASGEALGSMLAGASPFYRDTQAARAALELTGIRLQQFENLAESAADTTGMMGKASAEMGEAAEMGAVKAQAAYAEMKLNAGEAINTLAHDTLNLYQNTSNFLKLLSGNYGRSIKNRSDDILASAQNTGDWADAVNRLNTAYNQTVGISDLLVSEDIQKGLSDATGNAVAQFAEAADSLDQFKQGLIDAGAAVDPYNDNVMALGGVTYNVSQMFHEAKEANRTYTDQIIAAAVAEREYAESLRFSYEEIDTAAEWSYLLGSAIYDATYNVERHTEAIEADTEATAAFNVRLSESFAAIEAQEQAIEAQEQAFGRAALATDLSNQSTTNWIDTLFRSSAEMGINIEQFGLLAAATGEYSEAQITAMIVSGQMQLAVEEVTNAIASGNLSVGDGVKLLQDYEKQLAEDYTAVFDYTDILEADKEARGLRASLLEAAGSYSASFNLHRTITTSQRSDSSNPPSSSDSGGSSGKSEDSGTSRPAPDPMWKGGSFAADEWLLVGDDNGRVLPTSELVVFDRPGTVIPGRETNRILHNMANSPVGQQAESSAGVGTPAGTVIHGDVTLSIVVPAGAGESMVGHVRDGALEALSKVGIEV